MQKGAKKEKNPAVMAEDTVLVQLECRRHKKNLSINMVQDTMSRALVLAKKLKPVRSKK